MKTRLFTPGPTPVPHAVREAMARPMMHHRDKAFAHLLRRVQHNLAWVFGTRSNVLVMAASGTLAMEASVVNFLCRGDTALYVNSGKFGARWGEILRAYGVNAVEITVELGNAVTVHQVAEAFAQHPDAKALYLQACETATGVSHPVQRIAALTREQQQCLCIVDGITHVAIEPLPMDAWGIDVLLGATQKSFMMSAGLALIAVSSRAWQAAQRANLPNYYMNLHRERQAQEAGHTAWTSAVSLLYGLDVALGMMRDEGLEALYERHHKLAVACREGVVQLGCTPLTQAPANGLTVVRPPGTVAAGDVIATLQQEHGMRIGGGQDALVGQILRVAHMGYMDRHDVAMVVNALGLTLSSLRERSSF